MKTIYQVLDRDKKVISEFSIEWFAVLALQHLSASTPGLLGIYTIRKVKRVKQNSLATGLCGTVYGGKEWT